MLNRRCQPKSFVVNSLFVLSQYVCFASTLPLIRAPRLQTFLLAGHETTSTSLTWTLWTLARFPEKQTKLRQEIREARKKAKSDGLEEIESDDLNALPYLDAVTVRDFPLNNLSRALSLTSFSSSARNTST